MPDTTRQPEGDAPQSERIAKRIARAGLCSRRDAERWIADGRVTLDGEVLTSPAVTVTSASVIEVDGKPLPAEDHSRLFRFHKPKGYLTAASDPDGRKTINELIPDGLPRLMPIGRLDMNSEGLLLLTNDGGLKRQLELPSTGWQRRYRVRVHGDIDEAKLASLKNGISIDGFDYGPIEASLERAVGRNAWLQVALREGKNREIRRVMEHFGWPVNRLIRVSFGPFHLGKLEKGAVNEIKTKVMREQVGLVLRSDTPSSHRKRRLKAAQQNDKTVSKKAPAADEPRSRDSRVKARDKHGDQKAASHRQSNDKTGAVPKRTSSKRGASTKRSNHGRKTETLTLARPR
ncbi:MAG: pseudouridine synthase [Pseudomonadota bacterium]